uniref:Uncharacterized protein n=1 Tax=Oryza sativa subsp. japonica TaxID=39947 RepID=Q7Y1M2_ORYSJ|nr:hypothetical protein [Oryza sativa Japonica Group]
MDLNQPSDLRDWIESNRRLNADLCNIMNEQHRQREAERLQIHDIEDEGGQRRAETRLDGRIVVHRPLHNYIDLSHEPRCRRDDLVEGIPAFTEPLHQVQWPQNFKPMGIDMYDGKTRPIPRRPPLQPCHSSSSIVAFGRRCCRWVRKERKPGSHLPEAGDPGKFVVTVKAELAAAF